MVGRDFVLSPMLRSQSGGKADEESGRGGGPVEVRHLEMLTC